MLKPYLFARCIRLGRKGAGEYAVLEGCGLSEGDITVTTSLDGDNQYTVSRDWSGGNLTLTLMPVGARIAEWTGGGTAENPFDTLMSPCVGVLTVTVPVPAISTSQGAV